MSDPSRVLILGSYPPPFGGISSHLHDFTPDLVRRGHHVDIVAAGGSGGSGLEADGFSVHRVAKTVQGNFAALPRIIGGLARWWPSRRFFDADVLKVEAIRQTARPHARDADLVVGYHLLPWGLAAATLADEFHLPLVLVHFGEAYAEPAYYRRHIRQIKRIVERAEKVVSVSAHCARSLPELGVEADVEVVFMGVDVDRFHPSVDGAAVREGLGNGAARPVVLFVGRMIYDMGLDTFLDAVPSWSQRAATIIAGAEGELTGAARSLQDRMPGDVEVITNVPFSDLPQLYAAASVVVAPSPDDRSCMGLAIKEAMATGKPVVACRSGGIPEAVVHEKTGLLVDPRDPAQLSSAVIRMLDDPSLAARCGEAARPRAVELFSVDTTNSRMASIYEAAIASWRTP